MYAADWPAIASNHLITIEKVNANSETFGLSAGVGNWNKLVKSFAGQSAGIAEEIRVHEGLYRISLKRGSALAI